MTQNNKISTFLWFDGNAEEAARLYTSILGDSKLGEVVRAGGKVISVNFELCGQSFMALNGGPHYKFSPAISIFVSVETQAEVDRLWDALLAGGGAPNQCGWLQDRFGLSWQIVPSVLPKLLGDPDPARAGRAMKAMMGMVKLDIDALKRAAAGE